ncbi:MAG: zinc-ribbon domain-containing protein [Myxococcales bacterium]|nr:zinc-ribbon domain-containing protein [Myxococcales bacterium]
MQLECTQCGSRYAIPDEKVGGRRFRLPCGRCGSWIDVQGPSPTGEAPEDASFFVNLDGRVFGPLSETGVQALIELGRVKPDTLLWREGMEAWRPAGKGRRAWWLDVEDVGPLVEGFAAMLADWPGHPASLAALESLVRAGRLPDRAAAVLEPALRQVGAWPRLVTLWEDLLPVTDDAARRTRLLLRIGAARVDHLADPAGAFDSFAEAFRAAPDADEALDALQRVAGPAQAWERLAHVVAARARDVDDPALRRGLRLRLAHIRLEGLGALDAAQAEVDAVLADAPDDAEAHALRCALARRAGEPRALAAALEAWAGVAPAEVGVEARLELARVRAEQLGDAAGALDALEAAADVAPTEAVVDALYARFEAGPARSRVAARLLPLLAGAGDWGRLAAVQASMIDDAEPGPARAGAMRSLAELCHGRLGDADAAFHWLRRAFEEDPTDLEARGVFGRRARAEGRTTALVEAWTAVLAGPHGRVLAGPAVEASTGLPPALQERLVRAALAAGGPSPAGLAALDRLLTEQRRGLELAEVLEQRIEASTDREDAARLRRRLARLWQDELDGDVEALTVWRALLIDRPDDLEALEAVLAATEASGSAAAHVEALDALLAALPAEDARGPGLRRRRAHRVADLGDPARAVTAWRGVLVDAPDDAEALGHLERLAREAEDWGAVAEVLSRRLDADGADAELAFRLGRLFEERLGDVVAAQAAYARALAADAGHGEAHRRLARLLEADEQWAPLAALLIDRAEHEEGAARQALRARAADIHAEHLGRPGQALRLRCADLTEADAALAAHAQLAALAAQVDGWGVLAERWDALRQDAEAAPASRRAITLQLVDWWTTRLGRPADAEAALRDLLAQDAHDDAALAALATVQRRQADWAGLCDTLEARVAAGRGEATPLHLELAELYEGPLGEPRAAVRHLQAAAGEAPAALARLDELLTDAEDWASLDDVLARRVAHAGAATTPTRCCCAGARSRRGAATRPRRSTITGRPAATARCRPTRPACWRTPWPAWAITPRWSSCCGARRRRPGTPRPP